MATFADRISDMLSGRKRVFSELSAAGPNPEMELRGPSMQPTQKRYHRAARREIPTQDDRKVIDQTRFLRMSRYPPAANRLPKGPMPRSSNLVVHANPHRSQNKGVSIQQPINTTAYAHLASSAPKMNDAFPLGMPVFHMVGNPSMHGSGVIVYSVPMINYYLSKQGGVLGDPRKLSPSGDDDAVRSILSMETLGTSPHGYKFTDSWRFAGFVLDVKVSGRRCGALGRNSGTIISYMSQGTSVTRRIWDQFLGGDGVLSSACHVWLILVWRTGNFLQRDRQAQQHREWVRHGNDFDPNENMDQPGSWRLEPLVVPDARAPDTRFFNTFMWSGACIYVGRIRRDDPLEAANDKAGRLTDILHSKTFGVAKDWHDLDTCEIITGRKYIQF